MGVEKVGSAPMRHSPLLCQPPWGRWEWTPKKASTVVVLPDRKTWSKVAHDGRVTLEQREWSRVVKGTWMCQRSTW